VIRIEEIQIKNFDKLIDKVDEVVKRLDLAISKMDAETNELQEIKEKIGSIMTELNTVRTFDRPKLMKKLDELETAINKTVTY